MRKAGINAIRHFGPGIYDYNILMATGRAGIRVHYTFWVPETLDFVDDQSGADDLADEILTTVSRLRNQKHIIFVEHRQCGHPASPPVGAHRGTEAIFVLV